jgi:hypothetical protein
MLEVQVGIRAQQNLINLIVADFLQALRNVTPNCYKKATQLSLDGDCTGTSCQVIEPQSA